MESKTSITTLSFLHSTLDAAIYHEVLHHLEQKYVASLQSLHEATDQSEAAHDSLQLADDRIEELESQLRDALSQVEEYLT